MDGQQQIWLLYQQHQCLHVVFFSHLLINYTELSPPTLSKGMCFKCLWLNPLSFLTLINISLVLLWLGRTRLGMSSLSLPSLHLWSCNSTRSSSTKPLCYSSTLSPVCPSHMSTGAGTGLLLFPFSPPPTFPRGWSCSHQRKPRTFSSAVRTGGSTNKEQKLELFQLLDSTAGREKGQEELKPRNHLAFWVPNNSILIGQKNTTPFKVTVYSHVGN